MIIKRKIFVVCLLFGFAHRGVYSQSKLPYSVQTIQNELIKNFEDTGYGDVEIDMLHKKIALLLPKLTDMMETDSSGEKRLKLEVSRGESFKDPAVHYVITGSAYLYPGADNTLKKVVIEYIRETTNSPTYKIEKREMINPAPLFSGDNKMDANTDIILRFSQSLTGMQDLDKAKSKEIIFDSIQRHDHRMRVLNTYRQYLRKTLEALEKRVMSIELDKRMDMLNMIDIE
ncbi:MAG: hypothetical protein OEV66_10470 [Spirochaetia bacterium]|nr:hypothetical protein [Spirochaetia bacterium]